MDLKEKLDQIFSEYIRLRDSDDNGYLQCISCPAVVFWKEADCGHFVHRSNTSTRFDEINCNGQCRFCNREKRGNSKGYKIGLTRKYGSGILPRIEVVKRQYLKITENEYKQLIAHYTKEVKQLKQQKGL
jgi:bacteriophage lambda ninG protein